jgi:hypothetical protein
MPLGGWGDPFDGNESDFCIGAAKGNIYNSKST